MTIKEIASLAGVSISTVSKIINHKDASISPETRERVLKLVKEFNYAPYSSTASATAPNPYMIGVLIRSAETNLSLNGIISAAREAGYTVLVAESAGQKELELRGISAFCRHRVSGFLWEPLPVLRLRRHGGCPEHRL